MRGGDGLFEVEPVEEQQPQGRPVGVDKRFRAFDPHQVLLLPPSLDDWLPQHHLARFVADLVDDVLDMGRSWPATPTSAATRPTTRG